MLYIEKNKEREVNMLDIANLRVTLMLDHEEEPIEFSTGDMKLFYQQNMDIVLQVKGLKEFALRFKEQEQLDSLLAMLSVVYKAKVTEESVVEKKRITSGWLFAQDDSTVTLNDSTLTFYIRNLKKIQKNQVMVLKMAADWKLTFLNQNE